MPEKYLSKSVACVTQRGRHFPHVLALPYHLKRSNCECMQPFTFRP